MTHWANFHETDLFHNSL